MTTASIPHERINRLHVVAVTGNGRVVVCASDLGWRFLPGGKREAGESIDALITRELREEAGAELTGRPQIFGAHIAHSRQPEPYRPHFAHPRGFWAYAVAPVHLVGAPTSPPDGEQITEVQCLEPARASAYLGEHDQAHADLVHLADEMGLIG